MTTTFKFRRNFGLLLGALVVLAGAQLTSSTAVAQAPTGGVVTAVTGTVTINGQPATNGQAFSSGDVVETTGQNSSAVVSLGKLGRVEVHGDTRLKLTFGARRIEIELSRGSFDVSAGPGVTTRVVRQ